MTAALYIHIPFCVKKCDYCDFYSIPVDAAADERLMDRYIVSLCRDIEFQIRVFSVTTINSVYIGGGTPSALGARRMGRLLDFLRRILRGRGVCEFTVEVNPESTGEDFLRVCAEGGVTRISCGVQTFDSETRRAVGRTGEISAIHSALSLLSDIYKDAFSADLISGLPAQDEGALPRDIETLLRYRPAHISLYDLTLEENTPLYKNVISGKLPLPPPEKAEKLWIEGRNILENNGYAQYEVSNFAREGKRSLHNIVYWRMGQWIGAGTSASGTMVYDNAGGVYGERRVISASVSRYITDSAPQIFVERLDRLTLIKESFLMGFRYIDGPDEILFSKRFGRTVESLAPQTLLAWREKGMMGDGKIALNGQGLLMLNRFLTDCFLEMDRTFLDYE
ncbi:MAG: radical SAM family heme chaperone HemW [Treponema sp.]|nr:radical SAM family heme chaperone HemW [Treponema sp.]